MNKKWICNQTDTSTYSRGYLLYNNKNVLTEAASQSGDYYCTYDIKAIVKGSRGDTYQVYIEYDGLGEQLITNHCTCPAYSKYGSVCKHQVAALLHFADNYADLEELCEEEYYSIYGDEDSDIIDDDWDEDSDIIDDNWDEDRIVNFGTYHQPPTPTTSNGLKELIAEAATINPMTYPKQDSSAADTAKVEMEAHLMLGYSSYTLSFKLGTSRKYVLQNVYDFADLVTYKRMHRYGKSLSFRHDMEAFDDGSKPIVSYILDYVKRNPRQNYYSYYYGYSSHSSKELDLDIDELERFLLSCGAGVKVYLDNNTVEQQEYIISDELPPRAMTIAAANGGIDLSITKITGDVGPTKYIYFHDGHIFLDDSARLKPIRDFLTLMARIPDRRTFIADEDIPAFCNGLLTTLKDFYTIDYVDFDESLYALPTPIFDFYLDAPERNFITARIMAIYGDKSYNVYSEATSLRNMGKERAITDLVAPMFNAFDGERRELVLANDEERIYRFIKEDIDKLRLLGQVFVSDKLKRYMIKNPGSIEVGLSITGNLLDFKVNEPTMQIEELAEILSKYDHKKKYYRLRSGEFVDLGNVTNIEKAAKLVEALGITDKQLRSGEVKLPKYRAFYLDEFERSEAFYMEKNEEYIGLIHDMNNYETGRYYIPSAQKGVLREYQKTGYKWLRNLSALGFGGILADDMGLGKSLQVITFLQSMSTTNHKPSLIVCPASLVYNWGAEIDKFGRGLSYILMLGNASTRSLILSEDLADKIIITSYDLLRRDVEEYSKIDFFCQIIDEAQYIKNHNTQVAHAVKEINASVRFALTGTPIENRVSELWSIFDYLMPGYLYSYQRFNRELEKPIMTTGSEEASARLRQMIKPFVLRRLKKDVLKELPDKLEENYICQMSGEQEKLYRAHVDRLRILLDKQTDDDFKKGKIEILAELTKLRQLCCHPGLLYENFRDNSIKMDMCMNLIEDAVEGGHKILLFSQFTSMLDILTAELKAKGISYYLLTGQTPKRTRARMVEDFDTDDTKVFCISLKAGGTGLNLTAADIVIHFDPWWNVAVQNQATDRAHRIGQKQVVNVYRLVTKDTIEERIIDLQNSKRELADSLLSGDDFASGSFTREELLEILR